MANDDKNLEDFPKISRGNGVANDNLATLGDIMLATLKKVKVLENKIDQTNEGTANITKTIKEIDKQNSPREKINLVLLMISVIIGLAGLVFMYLSIK